MDRHVLYHVKEVVGRIVYVDHDPSEKERMFVRLFVRTENGTAILKDIYRPYLVALQKPKRLEGVVSIEEKELFVGTEKKNVYIVRVSHPKYLQRIKYIYEKNGIDVREHDVGPELQYFMERGISPVNTYKFTLVDGFIKKLELADDVDLLRAAIDIEVKSRRGSPDPLRDPVILVSYVDSKGYKKVFSLKETEGVEFFRSERELLHALTRTIKDRDPDIIYTYNGDRFDLPYLKERAKVLGVKLDWGRDGTEVLIRRTGAGGTAAIRGRAHIDVYRMVDYLSSINAIRTDRLDLESVYRALLGKEKIEIEKREIPKLWETNPSLLANYNLQDSIACFEIGEELLDLFREIGTYTLSELYEAVRLSASQMVEKRLIIEAKREGRIVPRRPKEKEVLRRIRETYSGGYVKEPIPGLYENIVVLDFRSLYPTIIISHNVDPELVNKPLCSEEDRYVSPSGHFFCKHPKGLLPSALERILQERFELKKKLKTLERGTREYKRIYARQQALKILANAAYGYLAFPRARWYSRECAEAITSWARGYIKMVMDEAEKWGFKVIYGDTDSVFLVYSEEDTVYSFLNHINNKLPGIMELELEDFYTRGIFIKKRRGERAAKKKYALLDRKGRLKIVGMEYVRRDWSGIARKVQQRVLEIVLKEGDVQKALNYVRKVIDDVRDRKMKLEDLIIYTEIQKELHEYEQSGPHVTAALLLKRSGYTVGPGTLIGYIIVEGPGSISDRAIPIELYNNRPYDANYYIEHQIIPAVLPIFETLGYSEKDLRKGTTQRTLFDFA